MPTMDDVARLAGVSRMTVSRAVSGTGYVHAHTRERILRAVEELGYRPDAVAQALASRRSRTLACVTADISDPNHSLFVRGMESIAFAGRYAAMVCEAHSRGRETDYARMFLDHHVGGAVFHRLAVTPARAAELVEGGVQCVLADNEEPLPGVSAVNADDYAGGRMAAEYLDGVGHTRIACLHGPLSKPEGCDIPYEDTFRYGVWRRRTAGFADAMEDLGLAPSGFYLSSGRFERAAALSPGIVDRLLGRIPRPTAVYCESDAMAIATLGELQSRGVRVPQDVAVMGHDGLCACRMLRPRITTIAQPRYETGREAARMLIRHIESACAPQTVVLKPTLMAGETA